MIRVGIGNVLDSKAQTFVNTVNCVGVMGKGIALEFKKRFPGMYADYVARCSRGEVRLGEPYLYADLLGNRIINFPTKGHWRAASREVDIVRGLEYLSARIPEWEVTSLAVPPLGCGNGGLEWQRMGPILFQYLRGLPCDVELYAPYGTPPEQLQPACLERSIARASAARGVLEGAAVEPAWVALVAILKRIQSERYHWPVGRVRFQKLAYFATREGLPTGLCYRRASYGPFAADLKRVQSRLINNNLLREVQRGQMFIVEPGSRFAEVEAALKDALSTWSNIIDRVTDLFLRIPDGRQTELSATVVFAADELRQAGALPSEMAVLHEVREWKKRSKQGFTDEEIAETIRDLTILDWLNVTVSDDLPVPENIA